MSGWLADFEQLKERVASGNAEPATKPDRLHVSDVIECPEVFQHRSGGQAASLSHSRELARALRTNQGRPFEPITVFWIGDGWCCIDGHHRVTAYRDEHYDQPIPVETYSGTIEQAMAFALQANSRDKLSMGRDEKSNAAWRIVIATSLSKREIANVSGVSERTVGYMRQAKTQIIAARPDLSLDALSWRDADRVAKGLEPRNEVGSPDWMEAEAQKLANALCKHHGDRLGRQPEVTARALEIYDQRLARSLAEHWGVPPDDFDEEDADESPDF